MTSELYIKILNEKSNEMKRVWGKGFLLMRDNTPSHISDKIVEFIKNIKNKICKDWPPYNPDLNTKENIWEL